MTMQGPLSPAADMPPHWLWPQCANRRHRVFEREDTLPVVLHANDSPAVLLRLVVERLRKGADLRIRKSLRRTVGVFALRVVVQHQHHEPRVAACTGVLKHLLVAGRVSKCSMRTSADHQVNALGLASKVVEQHKLRLLKERRPPVCTRNSDSNVMVMQSTEESV